MFIIGTNDTSIVNHVRREPRRRARLGGRVPRQGRPHDGPLVGTKHRTVFWLGPPTLGTEHLDRGRAGARQRDAARRPRSAHPTSCTSTPTGCSRPSDGYVQPSHHRRARTRRRGAHRRRCALHRRRRGSISCDAVFALLDQQWQHHEAGRPDASRSAARSHRAAARLVPGVSSATAPRYHSQYSSSTDDRAGDERRPRRTPSTSDARRRPRRIDALDERSPPHDRSPARRRPRRAPTERHPVTTAYEQAVTARAIVTAHSSLHDARAARATRPNSPRMPSSTPRLADLAETLAVDGKLSVARLDEHQVVAYDLAHARRRGRGLAGDVPVRRARRGRVDARSRVRRRRDRRHRGASRRPRRRVGRRPRRARRPRMPFVAAHRAPAFLAQLADQCAKHGTGPTHLYDDFELVAETFRRFAEDKIRPVAEHVHRTNADVPEEIIDGLGRARRLRPARCPRSTAASPPAASPTTSGMVVATEELSRGSLGIGGSLITRPEILTRAARRRRHRGAEAGVAAAHRERRADGRHHGDRARLRLRRRGREGHRHARRRRLRA